MQSTSRSKELESAGWEEWLLTLFPFVFEDNFSADHIKFWEHFWQVVGKLKKGEFVSPEELVIPIILGRGLGKSTMVEVAVLMRAAILNKGYCLYVCATDDQAREHIGNIKILIEHPDSRFPEFYPDLSNPQEKKLGGADTWNKDTFITKNGAIFRAKGLNSSMRGLRIGTLRPDQIVLDDIDDIKDSVAVAQSKLSIIKSSVLPVATDNTSIYFPQNLITEHSVQNQIYTGSTDAMTERTVIGVTKAFLKLDIESGINPKTNRLKHTILPTSIPSWEGFDIPKAQKFLDASGLDTFLAEYQNELDRYKSGKVIPEYDEEAQIISWDMFRQLFGEGKIPSYWKSKVGLDIGYSEGQYPHYSAWVFLATSAMNTPLPNKVFMYRGRAFSGTSIDDQAETIKREMYPQERLSITSWQMSHERTGEMMTLNQKYQLPFTKFTHYRAEDGVAQWRHLSRRDHSKPHPFKPDECDDSTGLYRIGCPELFYIVDDDQLMAPRDDAGLRLFREQVASWEYVAVRLTESGQTQQKPSKINDDFCDAFKCTIALFGAMATPLTFQEKIIEAMPTPVKPSTIAEIRDPVLKVQTMNASRMVYQQLENRMNKPKVRNPISRMRMELNKR